MKIEDLRVTLYADGADLEEMKKAYGEGVIKGFTTNPSLMKKAGVTDYKVFVKEVLEAIPDMPVSFEVFSDDHEIMAEEARCLAAMGDNVFVKIPITNTKGESSVPIIEQLSQEGIKLNITACFTMEQVKSVVDVLKPGTQNIVSIFAGRITNAGVDAEPIMKAAVTYCSANKPGTMVLWASSRELFNIIQADRDGVDIITVTSSLLDQIGTFGKNLEDFSLETVRMFYEDGKALGFKILDS